MDKSFLIAAAAALAAAFPGTAAGRAATAPPDSVATGSRAYFLMADFEGADPLRTPLQGYWYFFGDQFVPSYPNDNIPGNSYYTTFDLSGQPLRDPSGGFDTASFPPGREGVPGTRSLRFAYGLGTRLLSCGGTCTFDPFVAFGIIFANTPDTLDLSSATAISFWARSDSDTVRVNVAVGTRDSAAEAPDYERAFAVGPEWRRYSIPLRGPTGLAQPERGPRKPFVPSRIYGLLYRIDRGPNADIPANALRVDEVGIEDWSPPPPVTDGIRPAGRPAPERAPRGRPHRRRMGEVPESTVFPGCDPGCDLRGRTIAPR